MKKKSKPFIYKLRKHIIEVNLLLRAKRIPPPLSMDSIKEPAEFTKHLTTLSTGALLILIAFVERFFVNPKWRLFAVLSLLCLIVSTSLAARAYSALAVFHLRKDYRRRLLLEWRLITTFTQWAWYMFMSGLLCLVIFTIRNLF